MGVRFRCSTDFCRVRSIGDLDWRTDGRLRRPGPGSQVAPPRQWTFPRLNHLSMPMPEVQLPHYSSSVLCSDEAVGPSDGCWAPRSDPPCDHNVARSSPGYFSTSTRADSLLGNSRYMYAVHFFGRGSYCTCTCSSIVAVCTCTIGTHQPTFYIFYFLTAAVAICDFVPCFISLFFNFFQ